ncbi:Pyruvate phosphate dikinase, PEP/pyruvate-binding domain protein, partial [mine drainage metagenome]
FVETARVPKGFVATTYVYNSLRKVLSDKGVFEYAKLYANDKLSKAAYLTKISECFRDIEFEALVQDEILNWAKRIGERLVVRSSATQEDLSDRSFAGIFDSFLDVKPPDVTTAIKNVFKSMFSPRAVKYILENGIRIEKMEMACIVQEFIPNAKYGVGFFFEKKANKYCVI